MASIHTLDPQFRVPGFFTKENIRTISKLVTQTIADTYTLRKVVIPDPHILIYMQIVHEADRVESVSKLNERVVVGLVRSFLDHVLQQERANDWAIHRYDAYNHDPSLGIKPYETPKLRGNKVRRDADRGFRFHFTY